MFSGYSLSGRVNIFLSLVLVLNVAFWAGAHSVFSKWQGVPPVPSENGALMMSLGDREFSYRMGALTLQSLGDDAGQTTPLKNYNYAKLGEWFSLLHALDPASNHVPLLAAFYFGGTLVPKDIAYVVKYLAEAGNSPVGEKWRWLAHAAFLARHRMNDLDLALDLAYKLSKLEPVDGPLPFWARQMPVFILDAKGDKEDSRKLLEAMLSSSTKLHPNEVNFMKFYLIEQLGVPSEEVEAIIARQKTPEEAPARP